MSDLGAVLKSARPRAVAALRRFAGDLDRAEDAFQDAAEQALWHWPGDGLPDNPTGWLIQTGRRKLIDGARRDKFSVALDGEVADSPAEYSNPTLDDDLLRLIFACCHPAMSEEAQVALTLKIIAGLTTEDVALAFLVPVRTMEQRVARAKARLRNAGIPYAIPTDAQLPERLEAVLSAVYLIFNQGYSARREALTQPRLCREAIWLARLLLQLFPGHTELSGLLALMLFHFSRLAARTDEAGALVALPNQDRSLWDQGTITEATALLRHVLGQHKPGPYQTQAAIAALHCEALTAEQTDWAQIAALYEILERQLPSPVVTINRAVAMGEAGDIDTALVLLRSVDADKSMQSYAPYLLAMSRLLHLSGDAQGAANHMQQAISLTNNSEERRFLEGELARLSDMA